VPTATSTATSSSLRPWQQDALARLAGWEEGAFLLSAAPGAGKTRPALVLARELLRRRAVARVVVACPTTPLTRQWSGAAGRFGVELVPDATSPRPPAGFAGVAVTYARIASAAARWARSAGDGTLVIADEAHHLGDELAWGASFAHAFGAAPRWLLLSGTPFRSDACAIPGVRYDVDGVAEPDVSYSYADAVREGVCRPVTFVPYDGRLIWRSGDDVVESSFGDALVGRDASRRYRTAISTELVDGLPRILRAAHERLAALRAGTHPDAGGLVIAADGAHARRVSAVLREVSGSAPTVVLHTDAAAHAKLHAFRTGGAPWIVAVNMVSEGVDIPRLRVGVYATAAKTALAFRQIVGRFVRTLPDRPANEPSWLYLPADPTLRSLAGEVEQELRHVRRPRADEDPIALDEPRERRRSEPSESPVFVPVAADVSPQLALFGPAPPVAASPPPAAVAASPVPPAVAASPPLADPSPAVAASPPLADPSPAVAASPPLADPSPAVVAPREPAATPAYERRARLRDRRHALVADLRRIDGRSFPEINAWLNRATGVPRVEDASLAQLERSVDLLLGELERCGRRRSSPGHGPGPRRGRAR
jgi:superfamily II DNA or RNA helicase